MGVRIKNIATEITDISDKLNEYLETDGSEDSNKMKLSVVTDYTKSVVDDDDSILKDSNWASPPGGAILNGVDQIYDLIDLTSVVEASFVINDLSTSTTEQLVYLGTNMLISSVSGTLTLGSALTNATVYVDNAETTTLTSDSKLILIQFDSVDISSGYLGSDGTDYGAYNIIDLHFRNVISDASGRKARWNNGQPHLYVEPFETKDASNQLLTNGDMEEANPTVAWDLGTATFEAEVGTVHSGTQSSKLTKTAIGTGTYRSQEISTSVGMAHTISSWIYIPTAGGANIVQMKVGTTVNGSDLVIENTFTLDSWIELTSTFTATTSSVFVTFVIGNDNADYAFIDDVVVTGFGQTFSALPQNAGTNGWKVNIGGEISVANGSGNPITPLPLFDGKQVEVTTEVELVNTHKKGYRLIGITAYNDSGSSSDVTLGVLLNKTSIANADTIADEGDSYYSVNDNNFTADSSIFVTCTAVSSGNPVILYLNYEEI